MRIVCVHKRMNVSMANETSDGWNNVLHPNDFSRNILLCISLTNLMFASG